jgi:hypothetical protein
MREEDRAMTDEEQFAEDAAARARAERFGTMPVRVRPSDYVESVDTRHADRDISASLELETERLLRNAG